MKPVKKTTICTINKNDFSVAYWESIIRQLELPENTISMTGHFTVGMFSTDKEEDKII